MEKPRSQPPQAFTLIEIMIVVAIIGLLVAIAVPAFMRSRNTSQQNACISNLRTIEYGKEQAALAYHWTDNTLAITTIINTYIKGNTTPSCPSNGRYTYNTVQISPACTFVGSTSHRLP